MSKADTCIIVLCLHRSGREMSTRQNRKFIKLSEKRSRERCSKHLKEYNRTKNFQDKTLAESESMYEQMNQRSFEHNFDTAYVSSPAEDCSADNT